MEHKELIKLVKKVAKLYDESGATLNDLNSIECEIKNYLGFAFADNA